MERLLEAVRVGNWLSTAAALAGLSTSTVTSWLARGRDARWLRESGEDVPLDDEVYLTFTEDFEHAEAEAETNVVGNLVAQTRTSPHASLGMLKIRWPTRWREAPSQVEMSGRDGLPLSPVLAAMSDERLEAELAALDAEIAEADGETS